MAEPEKNFIISTLKEYAAPALVGVVCMLVWRDITEMRADVKLLVSSKSNVEARVSNLESEVNTLKGLHLQKVTNASLIEPYTIPVYGKQEDYNYIWLAAIQTISSD